MQLKSRVSKLERYHNQSKGTQYYIVYTDPKRDYAEINQLNFKGKIAEARSLMENFRDQNVKFIVHHISRPQRSELYVSE